MIENFSSGSKGFSLPFVPTAGENRAASLANQIPEGEGAVRYTRSPESARKLYESAATDKEKEMKKVSDEFASLLFTMVLKQMDQTIERTGFLDGGKSEEMFRSFVHDEYAKKASEQNGLSLAHKVYEQLYDANSRTASGAPRDAGRLDSVLSGPGITA